MDRHLPVSPVVNVEVKIDGAAVEGPIVQLEVEIDNPATLTQFLEISTAEERIETLAREFASVVRRLYMQVVREQRPAQKQPPVQVSSGPTSPAINLLHLKSSRDPLNVLPELAWREVLGKLTELSDLYNCWRTCHLFRDILRPREREIKAYVSLPSQWFTAYVHPADMRNLLDEFPIAVHQFVRDHPSMRPFDGSQEQVQQFEFVNPLGHYDWIPTYDFREDGIYSQIVPTTLGPISYHYSGTPFLGEQLRLSLLMNIYDRDPEDNQMWQVALDFLESHGEHVTYLTLELQPRAGTSYSNHAIPFLLHQLPTYLPNLKRLAINQCFWLMDIPSGVFPVGAALACLESLEIRCAFWYPETCVNCLLSPVIQSLITSYHIKLGKLHVSANVWRRMARDLSWPNLKELSLDTVTETFNFRTLIPIEQLNKLEKIEIQGNIKNMASVEECLGILRRIITNSASINTLALGGVWIDRLPWSLDKATIFPLKLRTLILDLGNCNMWSYMFLISRFTFVQNVQIYLCEHQSLTNHATGTIIRHNRDDAAADRYFGGLQHYDSDRVLHLNRLMHRGELYSSNLWRWLPRLQIFTYQFKVFTRKEYNEKISSC